MSVPPANVTGGYLLIGRSELEQIARDAADTAIRAGVAQVIATASESGGVVMRAREGRFDSAMREGTQSVSIRIFDQGRTGTATTSSLAPSDINLTVERAIGIARQVEPNTDAALPEPMWLARSAPEIPLFDAEHFAEQELAQTALAIEAAAKDRNVRVLDAGVSSVDACAAVAIGRDFDRSLIASHHSTWCSAIAEGDGSMVQDGWSSVDRRPARLLAPVAVGRIAADRALRKLGGRTIDTQTCPVVFDAVTATSLVRDVATALSGEAQVRKASFFPEGLGSAALATHLDLVEDPFEPYGLASGACDSEGVGGSRRHIVRGGTVEGLFLSCLWARKLGVRSTGSADGFRNLTLSSRDQMASIDALLSRMGRGLWVTELVGGAVDPVSGAYSKAAAGFWIEDGTVAYPVHDITVAGDLPTMLREIVAMGNDIHRAGAIRSGSLLIHAMRVSGR